MWNFVFVDAKQVELTQHIRSASIPEYKFETDTIETKKYEI